jgi:hypothetical protein
MVNPNERERGRKVQKGTNVGRRRDGFDDRIQINVPCVIFRSIILWNVAFAKNGQFGLRAFDRELFEDIVRIVGKLLKLVSPPRGQPDLADGDGATEQDFAQAPGVIRVPVRTNHNVDGVNVTSV